jgi:uncharacterized phiE125 gp8 family phage protein
MITRLITPPATEPVTLAEAKLHLKVDDDAEDTLITSFIAAARAQCEHILGRSLITQTWELVLDSFPAGSIELFNPAIISVTSVKYIDALTNLEVTLTANQYVLDKDSEPGWIDAAIGVSWPETALISNAVRVRYTAGYGAAGDVPESIKQWIKMAIGVWFKNREASVESAITTLPHDFYGALLDRYRIWRL